MSRATGTSDVGVGDEQLVDRRQLVDRGQGEPRRGVVRLGAPWAGPTGADLGRLHLAGRVDIDDLGLGREELVDGGQRLGCGQGEPRGRVMRFGAPASDGPTRRRVRSTAGAAGDGGTGRVVARAR